MFPKRIKNFIVKNKYYFFIFAVVILFFWPVFKGFVPFPGDLLASENPYREQSLLGFVAGSYPNKAQGPDVIKEIYPWRYFSVAEVKRGNLPLWNPYNFSGNPQLANFQTAVFYPFNVLYLTFDFNIAWTILVMLQPLLAALFMYLFLSRGLSISRFASFIGGVAFAFSSYMTVWIEYGNIGSTLLWLPLTLLFTKYIYEKLTAGKFTTLVGVLVLSILAGYIQGAFYIYVLSASYFLFLFLTGEKKKTLPKIIVFVVALILPIFIALFQLLPTLELFRNSTRGAYPLAEISKLLAPLYYWVSIFVPDFFGNPAARNYWFDGTYIERVMYAGVPILFFAFYCVGNFKKIKIADKKFFLGVSVFSLLITTNFPGVKFLYLLPIPLFSTTVPTRELSIFIFSVIVLACLGIDFWLSGKLKGYSKTVGIFVGIYVLIWTVVIAWSELYPLTSANLKITEHNLILPTLLAIFTTFTFYLKEKFRTISLVFITLLVLIDLLYFFNKITPFSPKELIYPDTPVISYLQKNAGIYRSWGYGSAYIPANYQTVDGTYSPEGNDPLHIASYGHLLASSKDGNLPLVLPRPDANIAPGYGPEDLKLNTYRQKILNLLGVRYVLSKNDASEAFPIETYKLVWEGLPWKIFENKNYLPRFFLTGDHIVIKNKPSILEKIYDVNFDIRRTLILEEELPQALSKEVGTAELVAYKSNTVELKTKTTGVNLLFLSDNYFPGWKAYVDGKPVKIYVADYTFRAVVVPEGEHAVTFSYAPDSFILGIRISIIALLTLIIVSFVIKFYEKKK